MTNRKSVETYSSFEREVHSIEIIEIEPMRIKIVVQGNQFMYKMVRNLVGMLVQIARGKILLSDLEKILESRDRALAPLTAPAHGLCLSRIDY
jgi:tRNA pseudouridine38-40 synthase